MSLPHHSKDEALPHKQTRHFPPSDLLEGLAKGETAIREGRIFSHKQARKKLHRWLK